MIKMKDSGIEWIGEIPTTWELRRLRFLCDIQTGNMDTQNNNPDGQYPFYVRSPKVEHSDSYTFDNEAVLMAGDGVGAGKVFHYVSGKYGCHQRVYSMSNFTEVTGKYLYYYLSENFYKKIEESNAKSTVDSVRLPMLKDFVVAFPKKDEQKKIVSYLNEKSAKIDAIIEKQQSVIEKLKEYKLSAITEAVTKGIISNCDMKDCEIEWVGKMPAHWIRCRLSDVTKRIIVGLATSVTPYYRQEGTVLLRNLNIKEGYLDDSELLYLDIDFAENQTGKFINAGDVLTVHTGSNLGLSCVVPLKYENTLSFTTLITTPLKEKLLPEYLMYTINSGLGKSEIDKLKCGDIKPNLNVRQFKYFTIFLPPIDEQKQIVLYLEHKLSQIDNLIFKKSKEIEKLQEYKKSLIYDVVTGKKEV